MSNHAASVSKTEGRRFESCRPCSNEQAKSLHSNGVAGLRGDHAKPRQTSGTDVRTAAKAVANPHRRRVADPLSGYARCGTITDQGRAALDRARSVA